jgi:hypothetical protein
MAARRGRQTRNLDLTLSFEKVLSLIEQALPG